MTLTADQLEAIRDAARLRPWHEITTEEIADAVGV